MRPPEGSIGFGLHDRFFIELGRDDRRSALIVIEVRPTARAHFQHVTAHLAQEITTPIADKWNIAGATHAGNSTTGARVNGPQQFSIWRDS